MQDNFRNIADRTAIIGSPWTFVASVVLTALWLILEPVFRFSDTWQLTMNTLPSPKPRFLSRFFFRTPENRDTRALQLKLDELIRSTTGARDRLVRLEDMSDDDLDRLQKEFEALKRQRSAR